MSNQWVRYVCKDTGDPFWYNNVSREQRWDPPPPPRPTTNESTLVSSDSVPGDDEAGKSALKGKAKLDSLAKTSKRKTQDKLVQPPTKKRDVLSDGRVAASETAEIVPPPSRLTAIEASFDPFDQTLNLKESFDKLIKSTSAADGSPSLPDLDELKNALATFKNWQDGRPEIREWKRKDPESGRVAARPENRARYHRNRFIENIGQTQAQNDADHLAHERREDQAEREFYCKALFKRSKQKMAAQLEAPPTTESGIRKRLSNIILPAIQYLHDRCKEDPDGDNGDRVGAMKFFEAALLLNPSHIRHKSLDRLRELADQLSSSHPKFNTEEFKAGLRNEIAGLKESSQHQAVGDKKKFDFLGHHWAHRERRPFSYKAAKIVAMSQPSSAAIERVFSLYRQLFSNNQGRLLADARTLSVRLNLHDRPV